MLKPQAFTLVELSKAVSKGFTLVELLVVISIIVILLALLTPALDRAIYQAELASCATRLRGAGNGAVMYATGQKRSYPYRIQTQNGQHLPRLAVNAGNNDDRPLLRDYININKNLQDPLAGVVDLETKVANAEVQCAYNLWFWVRFADFGGRSFKGMYRMGDRFTWVNTDSGQPVEYAWSFLASDRQRWQGGNIQYASHPDPQGRMNLENLQDWTPPITSGNTRVFTQSQWVSSTRGDCGPFDMNYASDDLSVRRYDQVYWNEWADPDGRTTRTPSLTNPDYYPGYADQVPRR